MRLTERTFIIGGLLLLIALVAIMETLTGIKIEGLIPGLSAMLAIVVGYYFKEKPN